MLLWRLFFTFLRIGGFTIGGGYVMLPIIQRDVVEREKWVKEEEFLDLIAVAQASPGVMAINSALIIGFKLAGIPGGGSHPWRISALISYYSGDCLLFCPVQPICPCSCPLWKGPGRWWWPSLCRLYHGHKERAGLSGPYYLRGSLNFPPSCSSPVPFCSSSWRPDRLSAFPSDEEKGGGRPDYLAAFSTFF